MGVEVHVVEMLDKILGPMDGELSALLQAEYAKRLVEEKKRYVENFDSNHMHIDSPTVDGNLADMHVGDRFKVTTCVYLAGLKPEEVEVEAY